MTRGISTEKEKGRRGEICDDRERERAREKEAGRKRISYYYTRYKSRKHKLKSI
jgi:hypothetical protein